MVQQQTQERPLYNIAVRRPRLSSDPHMCAVVGMHLLPIPYAHTHIHAHTRKERERQEKRRKSLPVQFSSQVIKNKPH